MGCKEGVSSWIVDLKKDGKKVSSVDGSGNKVLKIIGKKGNANNDPEKKRSWLRHSMRRDCLMKNTMKGNVDEGGKGRRKKKVFVST